MGSTDKPTAATETSPVTMPKMYGKPCRHCLSYGNLKSTVFRLCWSVTCASRPNRIGRSQTYNVMHCWRWASMAGHYLFEDHASGARDDRPGLTQALSFVRPGDVLVVWKLDRLGRSLSHLLCIVNTLKEKQVAFRSSHRRHGYHDGVGRVTVSCIRCACLV
jgi:hypothetical protein